MNTKKYTLNFDGGCLPKNPGGIAIGSWVIRDDQGKTIESNAVEVCRGAGATNNVAEWAGLVHGLRALLEHHDGPISIYGDSLLVIKQVNGQYQVRDEKLKTWKEQAMIELQKFGYWKAYHIPREQNHEADQAGRVKYKEVK